MASADKTFINIEVFPNNRASNNVGQCDRLSTTIAVERYRTTRSTLTTSTFVTSVYFYFAFKLTQGIISTITIRIQRLSTNNAMQLLSYIHSPGWGGPENLGKTQTPKVNKLDTQPTTSTGQQSFGLQPASIHYVT